LNPSSLPYVQLDVRVVFFFSRTRRRAVRVVSSLMVSLNQPLLWDKKYLSATLDFPFA
jgi:hypothetical protein